MNPKATTTLCCLLGHPVAHSISPTMHNTAFEALGLDYSYMAFDITEDQIGAACDALKLMNCRGFNLTMPLKVAVIPYLDELTQTAKLCQAVNTVINDNGKLIGHSTDGIGYMDSLADAGIDISGGTMTILGAGGAATSIIATAAISGLKRINIFKRKNATFSETVDFASMVTKETGCEVNVFDMADMDALSSCIKESTILTNATNVGMGDDDNSLIPKEFFFKDLIVSDIIYHPAKTRMLKDAEEAGCRIINGKYMLLFQGAAAFKEWTGLDMPVDLVKEKVFMEEE